jgi:acyl-coenzyme A thioesterase 13
MAESDTLSHVQSVWDRIKPSSPIYAFLLSDIRIAEAKEAYIKAELDVGPNHINSKGTLHGTVSACIVDWASSLAIAATGLERTGVSTDLHTTYVSTAKEGDVLIIEGKASKVGKNLAYTTVEIRTNTSVVAHGVHTKFVRQ